MALEYHGYRCADLEGEPVLAFHGWEDAVLFATDCQVRLLAVEWDTRLLGVDACRVVYDADGKQIWGGLSVAATVTWGEVTICVPDKIMGRPTYLSSLSSIGIDLLELTAPGQVLLDCTRLPPVVRRSIERDSNGRGSIHGENLQQTEMPWLIDQHDVAVHIKLIGEHYAPHGQEAILVAAVWSSLLQGRELPHPSLASVDCR